MASTHRGVAVWLLVCCVMVAVMVVLGGMTRLTHSGLSMVEWEPVIGIVPPLSESDWLAVFAKYRLTPEYIQVNAGMSLAGFKGIFWLEYIHRAWGRLIGLVFLLPFLWLAASGGIGRTLIPRLVGLFALGALQGGLGWFMVESGLVDNPAVSHIRLTLHLGLALLILAGMLWVALDILAAHRPPLAQPERGRALGRWLGALTALVVCTLLFGGLVAGLRAGFIYNTWPLMEGRLIPGGLFAGGITDLVEDIKTVQFVHRGLAELTVLVAVIGWAAYRGGGALPRPVNAAVAMAVLQLSLGIATLLLVVPVWLAALHQLGAVVLLCLCLWALHESRLEGMATPCR